MKFNLKRKFLTLLVLVLTSVFALAQPKSPLSWRAKFVNLLPGMSRRETEQEIAKIRKVKSTYELWAMDLSPTVAYRLDSEMILLATYKPGSPAARGINGQGGQSPIDGSLIGFEVLQLR